MTNSSPVPIPQRESLIAALYDNDDDDDDDNNNNDDDDDDNDDDVCAWKPFYFPTL